LGFRTEPRASVSSIVGKTVLGGEFSGKTIVLRIGETQGDAAETTIRLRAPWECSSCLGAVTSESVMADGTLEDLLVGLIGAEVTFYRGDAEGAGVLECGSIRIECRDVGNW
jgi:hypothetical protein